MGTIKVTNNESELPTKWTGQQSFESLAVDDNGTLWVGLVKMNMVLDL